VDLRTAILTFGRAEGTILKVERFLNHRIEPKIMQNVGRQLAAPSQPGGEIELA
jgi:hypothetical protein